MVPLKLYVRISWGLYMETVPLLILIAQLTLPHTLGITDKLLNWLIRASHSKIIFKFRLQPKRILKRKNIIQNQCVFLPLAPKQQKEDNSQLLSRF